MENSIKNVFTEQIKSIVKDNESIKYDILNAIKDNNEMSEKEAFAFIETLLATFNLNRGNWYLYTDRVFFIHNEFKNYVYHNIGYWYSKDKEHQDINIFNSLDLICSNIKEKDYYRFMKYFKNNYNSECIDIFSMRKELAERIEMGKSDKVNKSLK